MNNLFFETNGTLIRISDIIGVFKHAEYFMLLIYMRNRDQSLKISCPSEEERDQVFENIKTAINLNYEFSNK